LNHLFYAIAAAFGAKKTNITNGLAQGHRCWVILASAVFSQEMSVHIIDNTVKRLILMSHAGWLAR
jgi:hypothetical protein